VGSDLFDKEPGAAGALDVAPASTHKTRAFPIPRL
jgi:hypothetical protein